MSRSDLLRSVGSKRAWTDATRKASLPISRKRAVASLGPALLKRSYATHQSTSSKATSSRRQVTIANDSGRVPWTDLSAREKAARTTQQTFNFAVIAVGLVATIGVGYLMFTNVFSPNSKTAYFNQAVERVKSSDECTSLLGPRKTIFAYGESPWSSFARARQERPAVSSKQDVDAMGTEHIRLKFQVVGSKNAGWVNVHLARANGAREYEYLLLALDVEGHERVYLENASHDSTGKRTSGRILGLKMW